MQKKKKMAIANYKAYWKPRDPEHSRYSSHLPSWYSRSVNLSKVVENHLNGEMDPDIMQDHINADCAEFYDHQGASEGPEYEALKKLCGDYSKNTIPDNDVKALFMTVDVHLKHIDIRVRAWRNDLTSCGIDYFVLMPQPGRPLL